MKRFNVAGVCIPEKHYMVDQARCIEKLQNMIGEGQYLSLNRGRQYGKTTLLYLLERALKDKYRIIAISFEAADDIFESAALFSKGLLRKFKEGLEILGDAGPLCEVCEREIEGGLYWDGLQGRIRELCTVSDKPIVLIVD